jgi:hypothetical protein
MSSILEITEEHNKKDVILTLLEIMVPWMNDEDSRYLTERVLEKMELIKEDIKNLLNSDVGALKIVSDEYGIDERDIIKSFIDFVLLVETTMQEKIIYHQMEEIKNLKNRIDELTEA